MGNIRTAKAIMGYTDSPDAKQTCQACFHYQRNANQQAGSAVVRTWCRKGGFHINAASGCEEWSAKGK